jgi:RNA polymerase sigma factor (sigma-70 family)
MDRQRSSLSRDLRRVFAPPLAQYSDAELVRGFVEFGEESAFAAILDRHGPMVLGVCRRELRDVHLAEDVLQATFLVLARKGRSLRRRASLASWLYGVALRLARRARLSETARGRRDLQTSQDRAETSGNSEWEELSRVLDAELKRLPERFRLPLILCYLEGQTQDEAAKQLGCSLKTLRRRLESGRELLRVRLEGRGVTLGAGLVGGLLLGPNVQAALNSSVRKTILTSCGPAGEKAAISTSVLALVNGEIFMATMVRLAVGSAVALFATGALALGGLAIGIGTRGPIQSPLDVEPAFQVAAAPQAVKPAAGHDLFGDPLPAGATARLGTVRLRHGPVAGTDVMLQFSQDGKQLISVGGGWIRRWDLASGTATVNIGQGWQNVLFDAEMAVARDGQVAYTYKDVPPKANLGGKNLLDQGGFGKGKRIEENSWEATEYDVQTGKVRRTFHLAFAPHGAGQSPSRCLLSTDGKVAATLSYGGAISVWSNDTGVLDAKFNTNERFTAIAMTSDGKTIVAGDVDHTIHVLDVQTGKTPRTFGIANINGVARMELSTDAKWLATVDGANSYLRIWNLASGKAEKAIALRKNDFVQSMCFTLDSNRLVVGLVSTTGRDEVWLVDVSTENPRTEWLDMGSFVTVSPDGKTVAAMNAVGAIQLRDIATGKKIDESPGSLRGLSSVSFDQLGKTIRTLDNDLNIRAWDSETGKPVGPGDAETGKSVTRGHPLASGNSAILLPGSKLLVKSSNPRIVTVIDLATGKVLAQGGGDNGVVSPDGTLLAASESFGRVSIIDIKTGKDVHRWDTPTDPQDKNADGQNEHHPVVAGFTHDNKSVVLLGSIIAVCDVATGQPQTSWSLQRKGVIELLPGRKGPKKSGKGFPDSFSAPQAIAGVVSTAVSPDGSKIAFGLQSRQAEGIGPDSGQGRLMILETATGKLLHDCYVPDPQFFRHICFSPDGKLIGGCGYARIRVWEVGTQQAKWELQGHRGFVNAVAFSPDSNQLASVGQDGTGLVWSLKR